MEWTAQVDAYCERLGAGLWAEPVNALTNLAFVIMALWLWPRTQARPLARVLVVILGAIGIGSGLFHTAATRWAGLADVIPIGLYILTYLYAVNRDVCGWPVWLAALGTAAFIPYAMAVTPVFGMLPFLAISGFYWSVPLLIVIYALALRRRAPRTAMGLAMGAGILSLSLVFRSLDAALCAAFPLGTHFLWHLLNAVMLGWMIHVYLEDRDKVFPQRD